MIDFKVTNIKPKKDNIMDYINESRFIFFLNWMVDEKGFTSAKDIIHILEAPYKWDPEFQEFVEEYKLND